MIISGNVLVTSFMYNRNNRGPHSEPCGTPHLIDKEFELVVLYFTNCVLPVK